MDAAFIAAKLEQSNTPETVGSVHAAMANPVIHIAQAGRSLCRGVKLSQLSLPLLREAYGAHSQPEPGTENTQATKLTDVQDSEMDLDTKLRRSSNQSEASTVWHSASSKERKASMEKAALQRENSAHRWPNAFHCDCPDYFVSHSWHDPIEFKWRAMCSVASRFKVLHGREPVFWIDKFCMDQEAVEETLQYLPIFIMACKHTLVLCGPTYFERLWCVWELFIANVRPHGLDNVLRRGLYTFLHVLTMHQVHEFNEHAAAAEG